MNLHTLFTCLLFTLFFVAPCTGQSTWEQLTNHPLPGVERVFSFELDGVVYVGTGRRGGPNGQNLSSVHAYDVSTDTWTSKANFPGGGRRNAFGFQVGGKGYVGTGYDGAAHLNDFWKYDPADDTWTQLDNFPGGKRSHALAIAGDSTAYVLTGGRAADSFFTKDMWEFNPTTETWTRHDNFPGRSRWRAFGWIIGQKLYAGGGARFPNEGYTDFYVYDMATGTWNENEREECPTAKTSGGYYFSILGKGYYGEGSTGEEISGVTGKKIFAYNPATDRWTEDIEFIGRERILGFSAVVGDKAILGLGRSYDTGSDFRDIYAFTPGIIASTNLAEEIGLQVFPNPVSSSKLNIKGKFNTSGNTVFTLFDVSGRAHQLNAGQINITGSDLIQLEVAHLLSGVYQLEINNGTQRVAVRFFKL